jgi:hypothetical protein
MRTDGSAHWIADVQDGDLIQLVTPADDVVTANQGLSAVTATLTSVPTGINVQALIQIIVNSTDVGAVTNTYISDLATADIAPTPTTTVDIAGIANISGFAQFGTCVKYVRTNTSAQVRTRQGGTTANASLRICTLGYIDTRGKNV